MWQAQHIYEFVISAEIVKCLYDHVKLNFNRTISALYCRSRCSNSNAQY